MVNWLIFGVRGRRDPHGPAANAYFFLNLYYKQTPLAGQKSIQKPSEQPAPIPAAGKDIGDKTAKSGFLKADTLFAGLQCAARLSSLSGDLQKNGGGMQNVTDDPANFASFRLRHCHARSKCD